MFTYLLFSHLLLMWYSLLCYEQWKTIYINVNWHNEVFLKISLSYNVFVNLSFDKARQPRKRQYNIKD